MQYNKLFSILVLLLLLAVLTSCGQGDSVTFTNTNTGGVTGNVALTWEAPTTYTDNTSLTPAGYMVYYGPSSHYYTEVTNVHNVTSYTVSDLPSGKYYFAITVYDADGNESDFSQPEISADI